MSGPYPVTVIPHYRHELRDSTGIAIKFWLPWSTDSDSETIICHESVKFPVILEYLPYRKSDWTASRDNARYTWWCSHGYVCVRADMRGSGDSDGLYYDEYEVDGEQNDCLELIDWLASQPWCNGKVGMYGKSWGGFNGLQMAFRKPDALKAVISLYSTDDRYTDDVHYKGGCVYGDAMFSWANQMLAWNCRPPTPAYCSNDFNQKWKHRLENSTLNWATSHWLRHQRRSDSYWKNGSVNEDYGRIDCPVLIIGGINDGYINAAFRMSAMLNTSCRTIIGPWPHEWPDTAIPGPRIDYLHRCLLWWNYYLKDMESAHEVCLWPRLNIFIRNSHSPLASTNELSGYFLSAIDWDKGYRPSYVRADETALNETQDWLKYFYLSSSDALTTDEKCVTPADITLKPHALQGLHSSNWLCWNGPVMSLDQTAPNRMSFCFRSEPLTEEMIICGFARARLMITANLKSKYGLSVRLCDEQPDGRCTLISTGLLNLNMHANFNEPSTSFPEGTKSSIVVELDATTYQIPKGHRLTLSISPTYFPTMLPFCTKGQLTLSTTASNLIIQVVPSTILWPKNNFSTPAPLKPLESQEIRPSVPVKKCVQIDLLNDEYQLIKTEDDGRIFYPTISNGVEMEETSREIYTTNTDVDECRMDLSKYLRYNYVADNYDAEIWSSMNVTVDENEIGVDNRVVVHLNKRLFYEKTWKDSIIRECI